MKLATNSTNCSGAQLSQMTPLFQRDQLAQEAMSSNSLISLDNVISWDM
jgi:hypothetical protein